MTRAWLVVVLLASLGFAAPAHALPPVPVLTLDKEAGGAPLTVHATLAAIDPEGDPLTYVVDWGDGQQSTGALPAGPLEHTYSRRGGFIVRFTASDAGASDSASRVVTVTVPALNLVLGNPSGLGALLPGVERVYTATASATTSAPSASNLSVIDLSATAPGHLVNDAEVLASAVLVQATSSAGSGTAFGPIGAEPRSLLSYAGLIDGDQVTISFRQPVGAGEALRTGGYGKKLTFTLALTGA